MLSSGKYEIFEGKTLDSLFEDIYRNSENKKLQIKNLVDDLRKLINNIQDATMLVPLIKEYLEISVKNDEHLIKMAQIIQRLIQAENRLAKDSNDSNDGVLSEEERRQLLSDVGNYTEQLRETADKLEEEMNLDDEFIKAKEMIKEFKDK